MLTKQKVAIILLALLLVGGISYAGISAFGGWGGAKLAGGYLYEAEGILLYAKMTQTGKDEVEVGLTLLEKVTEGGGIPALRSTSFTYPATVNRAGELSLHVENPERKLTALFTQDELHFSEPLSKALPVEARFLAADLAVFESKREALAARIQQQAEEKREELAREKERAEKAKKVEQVARLKADLLENSQYLDKLDFSAELGAYEEQLISLQKLLDEVNAYAAETSLHRTEYEVMAATVESMKVLRDGVAALADTIERKKQNVNNLISILEADRADLTHTWEEIASEVPDAESQLQELNRVTETATLAIARAKERMAASAAKQTDARQQAEALYQQALAVLGQTKAKHGF